MMAAYWRIDIDTEQILTIWCNGYNRVNELPPFCAYISRPRLKNYFTKICRIEIVYLPSFPGLSLVAFYFFRSLNSLLRKKYRRGLKRLQAIYWVPEGRTLSKWSKCLHKVGLGLGLGCGRRSNLWSKCVYFN